MRSIVRGSFALVAVAAAFTGTPVRAAASRVLTVPGEFRTIQAAIDAAPKIEPVEIRVAAGTYDEKLWIEGFAELHLTAEPGTTLLSRGGEPAIQLCSCLTASVSGLTIDSDHVGVFATGIFDLRLDAVSIPRSGSYGVEVEGAAPAGGAPQLAQVPHMHYGHLEGGSGAPVFDQTKLSVSNSSIESAAADALYVHGKIVELSVSGCSISASQGTGVRMDGGGVTTVLRGTLYVHDCTIRPVRGAGILAKGAISVTVDGTTVRDSQGTGILLTDRANGSVRDCNLEWIVGAGIETRANARLSDVAGCRIERVGGNAIDVNGGVVQSCVVSSGGSHGIVIAPDAAASVVGNQVRDVSGTGILDRGGESGIADNVVSGTGASGIETAAPLGGGVSGVGTGGATIVRNSVSGARTVGILVQGYGTTISSNDVSGTGGAGIVAADVLVVDLNTVTDAGGTGIETEGTTGELRRNSVSRTGGDGIVVGSRNTQVSENVVADAAGAGIRADGAGVALRGNKTQATGAEGLVVAGGWESIERQEVSGAGADGIAISGAPQRGGGHVESNTVTGCAGDGIDLGEASGCRVTRNTVVGAGVCGFRLGDASFSNRLTGNRAESSGDYDLWEGDGSRRNTIARSNQFKKVHRRSR